MLAADVEIAQKELEEAMSKQDLPKKTSRRKLDKDIVEIYASVGCKHCYGRGYHTSDNGALPENGGRLFFTACKCVIKNMKKYG